MHTKAWLISIIFIIFYLPLTIFGVWQDFLVSEGKTIDGDLLKAGKRIVIDGTLNGDMLSAAETVRNQGVISGDVLALGSYIHNNGRIQGNARLVGREVFLDGGIEKNLSAVSFKLNVQEDATVRGNLIAYGSDVTLAGMVDGKVIVRADTVTLAGEVSKDVEVYANSLVILPKADFKGSITYFGPNPATVSDAAQFTSPLVYKQMKLTSASWQKSLQSILGLLVLAILISLLIPRLWHSFSEHLVQQPGKHLMSGLLFIFIAPIFFVLFLLFKLGAFSGIALSIIYFSFGASAWILARIAWGSALGIYLWKLGKRKFKLPRWGQTLTFVVQTFAGTLIISLLGLIPFVGFFMLLGLSVLTLGAFLQLIVSKARWARSGVTTVQRARSI